MADLSFSTLRSVSLRAAEGATRFLSWQKAPLVFGLLTALVGLYVWGSLDAEPVVHDETAYLFQAKLFEHGHWTAPSPPVPEFFEQYHLLLTPTYASKYWPGHSLLLAPAVGIGLPGLAPLLLSGLAAVLLFSLARTLANGWVALFTWFLWTTSMSNLSFQTSYLSETSTAAFWLLGWWSFLLWRREGRFWPLLLVVISIAWGAITRPLSAIAYSLPLAPVVLRTAVVRRQGRRLVLAATLGLAILAIVPVWSRSTTGGWWKTPYFLHTQMYFPFVHLGFGEKPAVVERDLPRDMKTLELEVRRVQAAHQLALLPAILRDRLTQIAGNMWGGWRGSVWRGWRVPLSFLAIFGIALLPAEGLFAFVTAALLIGIYLLYAHPPQMIVYYYEIQPVLAMATALGIFWWAHLLTQKRPPIRGRLSEVPRATALLLVLVFGAAVFLARTDMEQVKEFGQRWSGYYRGLKQAFQSLPGEKAIVFVRYSPSHNPHHGLIRNEPDLGHARIWVVCDREGENTRLLSAAPDRVAYLFDEASGQIVFLGAAGTLRRSDPRSP
jgi:hypothetical protein